jgi:hypothetical protein
MMALFKKSALKKSSAKPKAETEPDAAPVAAVADIILADIAMRAAETMLRRGVDRVLPGSGPVKNIGGGMGSGIAARLIKIAALRIATRSVPGAIAVGGALIAKSLYDRRRAKAAKAVKE